MIYTDEMIKQKNKQKQKLNKIVKIITYPIAIVILLLVLYMGYIKCIKHEKDVSIFGFRQYVVATGSMEPKYNVGDLIIVKEIPEEEIKIGDIITAIDGKEVKTMDELNEIKNKHKIGDTVTLKIYRESKYQDKQVKLGESN